MLRIVTNVPRACSVRNNQTFRILPKQMYKKKREEAPPGMPH
jgi:hypothetical protein